MSRFSLDINKREGGGWTTDISGPIGLVTSRQIVRLGDDGLNDAMPQAHGIVKSACPLCSATDAGTLFDKYVDVRSKRATETDLAVFGHYLFETMIGSEAWLRIQEVNEGTALELLLSCDAACWEMNRLPWEMMNDGTQFLAERVHPRIAITRTVSVNGRNDPLNVQPDSFKLNERLLFVVGSPLDDERVRSGAEYMGLLRELTFSGIKLNVRLLLDASPKLIKAAVETFKPSIVHIATHGRLDRGRGLLQLMADQPDEPVVELGARELHDMLRRSDGFLPILVLSACETGSAGPAEVEVGPLAADLVNLGFPYVVGMSGPVANHACRLFTRRFYTALFRGAPVSIAAASGRRAGLFSANAMRHTFDWALPTLFATIPERPVDLDEVQRVAHLAHRAERFREGRDPIVFCDRHRARADFQHLLDTGKGSLLLVTTGRPDAESADRLSRYGKTWFLREMAAEAVLDGHLPLLLTWQRGLHEPPRTFGELLDVFREVIQGTYTELNLQYPGILEIESLHQVSLDGSRETLHADLRRSFPLSWQAGHPIPIRVWRVGLQRDLQALSLAAALRPGGRVVLMIDDLETLQDAVRPLLEILSPADGLGTSVEPIPVILAYAPIAAEEADLPAVSAIKAIGESARRKPIVLGPFPEGGESYSSYAHWLLHLERPLVIDVRHENSSEVPVKLHEVIAGIPSNLRTRGMPDKVKYYVAALEFTKLLVPANDQNWLTAEENHA